MSYDLKKVLEEARENSSSRSNLGLENDVMRNMLNDPNFKVGVYKEGVGQIDQISMYETSRNLAASIISNAANINKDEAKHLADNYNFNKNEANDFIAISKEFINSYITTGNKINFGAREDINVGICLKHVEEKERVIPPGGVGNNTDKDKVINTPAYNTLKVTGKNLY